MDTNSNSVERVIGFDSHPDSFTAAILQSPSLPAALSPYTNRRSFRGLPIDKPHTRRSR